MAQFRTTADLVDSILTRIGQPTDGTSPYETRVLNALNQFYVELIAGGTIFSGTKFETEVDENWAWALSRHPIILELQPKETTGSISLTQGSEVGTFSSGPTPSLQGWFIKMEARDDWFKIATHSAGGTACQPRS